MDETDGSDVSSPQKLSKTPSWVMLGFLLGGLFVWALPRAVKSPAPATPPVVENRDQPTPRPIGPPRVSTAEALFAEWGRFAIWDNDVTEVALWNPDVNRFADFFEVIRFNGNYYFRSISRLTRPVLTHGGVPADSPMQFTEPAEHRQRFLKDVSEFNKQAFSDVLRETLVGKGRPEAAEVPPPVMDPTPTPTPRP